MCLKRGIAMTNTVRDEMVENQVRAHVRRVQPSAQPDDDETYQEGGARHRQQQVDYERHTSDAQACDCRQGRDPCTCGRGYRGDPAAQLLAQGVTPEGSGIIGALVFGLVIILCALLVWALLPSKAHAQTPATSILVRACPTQPTTTGFSACTNSTWSVPAPTLIVDVQRNSVDLWITPAQLQMGDRVVACEDASLSPGPFKACPSFLPGQTNNYLDASAINFAPAPLKGSHTITWPAITTDDESPPVPLTAAQTVNYQVFVRIDDGSEPLYPSVPALDTATTTATLTEPEGLYCIEVGAYFTGQPSTLGPLSDETCLTFAAQKITPAKVVGVQVAQ